MKKITEGFENLEDLRKFEDGLKEKNELLFHLWKVQLNLALRISDVLKITIVEAENYLESGVYLSTDKKTGKRNQKAINPNARVALEKAIELRKEVNITSENPYLFVGQGNRSRNSVKPIDRIRVFRVYQEVVDYHNIKIQIGTHSARKTWGLQAYNKTNNIAIVMKMLNHSSESATLCYLGLTQAKMDEMIIEFNL
jgi:site-specific recombinase XerD